MPDQRNARPVSGEIMAAGSTVAIPSRPDPCFDFVDAEFETIDGRAERHCAGAQRHADASRAGAVSTSGMAVLRRHRAKRPSFGSVRAGPPFWIAGVGAAAVAFWISGGHALLRQVLFSPPASVEPLTLADLNSHVDTTGGRAMLSVDGQAVNGGGDTLAMPSLKIDVVSRVVDLKFLSFPWHQRSGTSNP